MVALVIAEHDNQALSHTTLSTMTAASLLQSEVVMLVIGYQCATVAEQAAELAGVKEVFYLDHSVYEHQLAENMAEVISQFAINFTHVLAPASTFGKNIMPRVAGLLGVAQLSDIVQVVNETTFIRPIYAGNALATVESLDPIKLITVRSTSFEKVTKGEQKATILQQNLVIENTKVSFIEKKFSKSDRPELTAAKIVVSGGRGLQNAENFRLLEELATQLGAAIGASRAAVDAGFVPNDYQVGQTGKVVAPELYIAIGISGAIQHIAGMKDSKIIVAINKDPEAPIFNVADYGLVADLFKVLPELVQALNQLGYRI